ncbi:guanine deaminase [Marinitenerispora sediminis]|uniref:Guanine deaminase n=1 Tax=Marinitenerispora sediminis TaxID=1931232 RepID=A0A368SYA9_9ACTN|nr:guanine deaminase [Marinitenerispora sediminis]RCV48715.1 guanine deaminase [Marinitenerispora sediminis]
MEDIGTAELNGAEGSASRPGPTGTAVRGRLLWYHDDPFVRPPAQCRTHVRDGLLVCADGRITYSGPYDAARVPPGYRLTRYDDRHLIIPGFVDTHVHSTQTNIIAAHGAKLIEWLERYIYPEELRFSDRTPQDRAYTDEIAKLFCDELLRNGTTTALVHCATHSYSVESLFREAAGRRMRIAAGKVLMDRGERIPEDLLDPDVGTAMRQTEQLISDWHERTDNRLVYAITPRFAVVCSDDMLREAGRLWARYRRRGVLMQTHIAENPDEVYKVRELFPDRRDYLDVYEHYGLTDAGAVLAHGVYLSDDEMDRCHARQAALSHCPTSNLFLGSGRFNLRAAKLPHRPLRVGLGTDVGGGTSHSLLTTMNEAYKVAALGDYTQVTAEQLFYLATLGGATAMGLQDAVGTLEAGSEADFVVLDLEATPILAKRTERHRDDIGELLFSLAMLGDDRMVRASYVDGRLAYERRPEKEKESKSEYDQVRCTSYDWAAESWRPSVAVGGRSKGVPVIDAYAGGLHCVFRDEGGNLRSAVYDGRSWSVPATLPRPFVASSPTIAAFDGSLHVFSTESGRGEGLPVGHRSFRREDGAPGEGRWHYHGALPKAATRRPPAAAAYDGRLRVFFVDTDRWLWWMSRGTEESGDAAWTDPERLWQMDGKDASLTAAPYAGHLYVLYNSAGLSAPVKCVRYGPPAEGEPATWHGYQEIPHTHGSFQPGVTPYNGLLYACGHGVNARPKVWSTARGTESPAWGPLRPLPGTYSAGQPRMTAFHGDLYCVYTGKD